MRNNPFGLSHLAVELSRLHDPVRQMRELAESVAKPYRDHERMMRSVLEPFQRSQNLLADRAFLNALRQQATLERQFQPALSAYKNHEASLEKMFMSYRPQTAVFPEMLTAALTSRAVVNFLVDAERLLDSLRVDRVTATGATVNGEEVSFAEAEKELEQVWAGTASLPADERLAATTTEAIQTHRFSVLWLLLGYVLQAIFESPIQTMSDPVLVPRAQVARKWLQKNFPTVWLTTAIPDLRVVTRSSLDLRLLPRNNAARVGTLYEGDRVEVLSRQKDWTEVVSADDPNRGGWVFTRYLKRLPTADTE